MPPLKDELQAAEQDGAQVVSWLGAHPKAREVLLVTVTVIFVFMLGRCSV